MTFRAHKTKKTYGFLAHQEKPLADPVFAAHNGFTAIRQAVATAKAAATARPVKPYHPPLAAIKAARTRRSKARP